MSFGNTSVDRAVDKNQENIPNLNKWVARLEYLHSVTEDSTVEIFEKKYRNYVNVTRRNRNSLNPSSPDDIYISYSVREKFNEIISLQGKVIDHWLEANRVIEPYRSFHYEIERLHDNGIKCLAYTYFCRARCKMTLNGQGSDDILKDIFKALEIDGQRLVRTEEHEDFLRFLFDYAVSCYIMGYNDKKKALLVLEYYERFIDPSAAKDLKYMAGKELMKQNEYAFLKKGYDRYKNIMSMLKYIDTIFSTLNS